MIELLIDKLPNSCKINGLSYQIDTDFKTSLKFAEIMESKEYSNEEKIEAAIKLYFGDSYIEDCNAAMEQILMFYSCGKSLEELAKQELTSEAIFSYSEDSSYIYAAFYETYGVNLRTTSLHWWEFRALFDSLPENCKFIKIIGYRTIKITKHMSDEQKKFYRDMKKLYKLKDNRGQEEKEIDFANALSNL